MKSYFRVRISRIPSTLEQDLTQICFKFNSSGISEALQFVQKNLQYDPDLIPSRVKDFDVYFENKPEVDFYKELHDLSPSTQVQTFEEEHKDWLEEWKKGFEPFQLVGPFWVVPSWREIPENVSMPIRIDPGMAFGTGTHATTQLAASLIYKLISQLKEKNPSIDVLDVGTGTAILAMLAKAAGASLVAGIEIDPEARRVARDNVKLNSVDDIMILDESIEELKGVFDITIANIIDGVLINIKEDLLRVTKPGGYLVLTGILTEREDYFLDKFMSDAPIDIIKRISKDEWVGFLVEKRKG